MSGFFDMLRMSEHTGPPVNDPSGRTVPAYRGQSAVRPPSKPLGRAQAFPYAALFLILAGILSPVTQYNLSPVYGAIPTAQYQSQIVLSTALLAFLARGPLRKWLKHEARFALPVWAYYIPPLQYVLFSFSAQLGPDRGPLITQVVTYAPALFLAFLSAGYALEEFDFGAYVPPGGIPIMSYALFWLSEKLFGFYMPAYLGTWDFFTRSGLQLLVASGYAFMSSSQYLVIAVPALLHTLLSSPHYHSVQATRRLNLTLILNNYTLLERRDSITGYISVLESRKDEFRVMRCDHSLLGGDWLATGDRLEKGQKKKETIYSVFTMLESVRLVTSRGPKPDTEKDALFIGLGIGTGPTAFITHGINTTIVEIDPVVHEFATKYFDLPVPHTAVFEDAVSWVASTAFANPKSYDYIIHDVFTGGAEPTPLFTTEFLTGLSDILADDGVIAINYAGDTTLPPPRIIINTITSIFPTCRIFRDTLPDDVTSTFINMVVLCTKQADTSIRFRTATDADFLESLARRNWIPPQDDLEILMEDVKGWEWKGEPGEENEVLRALQERRVDRWHNEAARRHWKVMRGVLPDKIWELW